MSINNPYAKKSPFERLVYNFTDEIVMTKRQKNGKLEMVDDIVIELDECWDNESRRFPIIRLFTGSCNEIELIRFFQNGVFTEENRRASEQGRQPVNPFPFDDLKEQFIKTMIRLRVIGLVQQMPGEVNSREGSTYMLTDEGIEFVIKKIVDEIGNENFDAFMVLLVSDEEKLVPFSYILMKVIEQRRYEHDQFIAIVDDLGKVTASDLLEEYKKYLEMIEGENLEEVDESSLFGSVLKKISKLVQSGMVTIVDNYYILTEEGNVESNAIMSKISSFIDILNKTGIIELERKDNRYYVSLTRSGKVFASKIRDHFENDRTRILQMGSVLNDMDDHETDGVLPVHQYVARIEEARRNMQLSLYVFDEKKVGISERVKLNLTAVAGTVTVFFVCLMMVSFFTVGLYPNFSMKLLLFSAMAAFCSACLYTPAKRIVYRAMNKPVHRFISEEYKRRQKKKRKKLKKKKH